MVNQLGDPLSFKGALGIRPFGISARRNESPNTSAGGKCDIFLKTVIAIASGGIFFRAGDTVSRMSAGNLRAPFFSPKFASFKRIKSYRAFGDLYFTGQWIWRVVIFRF